MQRKFKFALCIFLAIFALMCTASALDIYVSNAGDDTAAGTADAAVATLTQAYFIPQSRISPPLKGGFR